MATAVTPKPKLELSGDFWKYWLGQIISALGNACSLFALPLLVYQLTGKALNLALAQISVILPYLLFGLVIGAWVDRNERKRLMVLAEVARAAITASIPILAALGMLEVWWIYVVGFLGSTMEVIFDSGQYAVVPNLVRREDVPKVNGWLMSSWQISLVGGQLLSGVLVAIVPLTWIIAGDAATFLISAASLLTIRSSFNRATHDAEGDGAGAGKQPGIWSGVATGLRYVWQSPLLRNITLLAAAFNFLNANVRNQLVLFVKQHLGASDSQWAVFSAAGFLGIMILSLQLGWLSKRYPIGRLALGLVGGIGLLTMMMALTTSYWLSLILWMAVAGLVVVFTIAADSLRQLAVPDHMLATVMNISAVIRYATIPIGGLLGGLAIDKLQDVGLVYFLIGAVSVVIALVFAATPLGRSQTRLAAVSEEVTPSVVLQNVEVEQP